MIYYLDKNNIEFPNPHDADDDGLLAIGGKVTPEWVMAGYELGIFQWYAFDDKDEPHWWCPPERFVIFPDEMHISHSLRQLLRSGKYRVTFDQDFERVMRGCGSVNGRHRERGRWLGEHLMEPYLELHRRGIAHSVEVWKIYRRFVWGGDWSHVLWREYVLVCSQCFESGIGYVGRTIERARQLVD